MDHEFILPTLPIRVNVFSFLLALYIIDNIALYVFWCLFLWVYQFLS